MKILIIKQTSLGDVLHSTCALEALRSEIPGCEIHFLTDKSARSIVENHPSVSRIFEFDFNLVNQFLSSPLKVIKHISSLVSEIRREKYDLAFDLQGLERSVFFLYACRSKFKFAKAHFPCIKGFRDKTIHATEEILQVLRLSGLKAEMRGMAFYTTESAAEKAETFLASVNPHKKRLLVFSPFTRWETKNWPLAHWQELCLMKSEDDLILLAGSKSERALIAAGVPERGGVVNIAGLIGLDVFAEVLRRSAILVTADSFPMHLGCAVNIPVTALFGPTWEEKVGPVGDKARVIRDAECGRCYSRKCTKGCMSRIAPQAVYQLMQLQLKG